MTNSIQNLVICSHGKTQSQRYNKIEKKNLDFVQLTWIIGESMGKETEVSQMLGR